MLWDGHLITIEQVKPFDVAVFIFIILKVELFVGPRTVRKGLSWHLKLDLRFKI